MSNNKSPSFGYLRVLGCLCYATNLVKGDKLGPRTKPTIRLGFLGVQKGYIFLDIELDILFVSNDVTFREIIFPFKRKGEKHFSLSYKSSDYFHDMHLIFFFEDNVTSPPS